MFDRLKAAKTFLHLQLVGEFHHQDTMFGNEADQSDEPDLRINIHARRANNSKDVQRQKRAEHRGRQSDENNERIAEAFELRREDKENHDEREDESDDERIAFLDELPALALVIDAVALRQMLFCLLLQKTDGLAKRAARARHALQRRRVQLLERGQSIRLRARREARNRREPK